MSTFNGLVPAFPRIRIDFFRKIPAIEPPLACFLSHVHSDHLLGLDSFKGPFIYCSSATREMLLKLEKYPHRINFAKGITQVVPKTYRHLSRLLKPLPLETPTVIELSPGYNITVTLFNANHCLGAVSFLIEGNGNAVLYTGDIRAEAWLLDSWARNPRLLPYLPAPHGPGLRRLSTVYADTTFMISSHVFAQFPPKAQGLSELYTALYRYPQNTIFYMHAWTFGYEDVLSALAGYLNSPVHLDRYRYDLYTSIGKVLSGKVEAKEAACLCGFNLANNTHPGILTTDKFVRLHSCEKGSGCPVVDGTLNKPVVRIKPIVGRVDGFEIEEIGLGGGQGDLNQLHELDLRDRTAVQELREAMRQQIEDPKHLQKALNLLDNHLISGKPKLTLRSDLVATELGVAQDDLRISQLIKIIAQSANANDSTSRAAHSTQSTKAADDGSALPLEIRFPYSRHSSHAEMYSLISLLQPRDVIPCVAPGVEAFTEDRSMEYLFGYACEGSGFLESLNGPAEFSWDKSMRDERARLDAEGVLNGLDGCDETYNPETQQAYDHDTCVEGGSEGKEVTKNSGVDVEMEDTHSNSANAYRTPTSSSTYESAQATLDGKEREALRTSRQQLAFDAAAAGEWHRISLACVAQYPRK